MTDFDRLSPAVINNIPLFDSLTSDERNSLAGAFKMKRFVKGETVMSRKDNDRGVYFLLDGAVRVTSFTSSGKEASYKEKTAGDMFGELSALDGEPRAADVLAISDTTLLFMDHSRFNELLSSHYEIAHALILSQAKEIRSLTRRIYDYAALSVRYRVYGEIYRLGLAACGGQDSVVLDDMPTHADIASRVTTTREAVTREVGRLMELSLIEKAESGISIPSLSRLKALLPDD